MNPVFMTIVFPAYNENLRIRDALLKTALFVKGQNKNIQVLVIENGSTDDTYNIAVETALDIVRQPIHNIAIRVERSTPGKGSALRYGMELSSGEYVLLTDVDLSTPLREAYRLMAHNFKGVDLSIGSRNLPESVVVGRSKERKLVGSIFGSLTSILMPGIRDTQCGFKIINRNALEKILPLLTINGFAFDVELLFVARLLGFKIKEIPVYWEHDQNTTVNLVPDSFKMVRDIIKIAVNYASGRYRI